MPTIPKIVPARRSRLSAFGRGILTTLNHPDLSVSAANPRGMWICVAVSALTLVALVLLMWLPYTMNSGFDGETSFVYSSETTSFWKGFIYQWDPLRPFTSLFYHLGYVLSNALQMRGSFVPYQMVHAALWLARGFLTFLILRKFLPEHIPFCFLAGAIVVLHASDGAIGWVGQMNQYGFIFWMLLAFYLLNLAVESSKSYGFVLLTLLACLVEYMSLWSYEAQIFLIILAPLMIGFFRRLYIRRAIVASVLWYAVPARYVFETLQRYQHTGGASYQESVLRKSWKVGDILADWWFDMRSSLEFWIWTRDTEVKLPLSRATHFAEAGAVIFVIGGAALLLILWRRKTPDALAAPAKPLWWALGTGVVVTILSFPVYLLLQWQRSLWRTQFLSGIGVAITLAAIACLVSRCLPNRAVRTLIFLACGAAVAYSGVHAAIVRGAYHRSRWDRHRSAIAQILAVLPRVRPETVVIYTGVPKHNDPFTDNMWFDMAMRLSYPDIRVAGQFFYDDGTAASGSGFDFDEDHCRWNGAGFESLVKDTSVSHVVAVEYQPMGSARIAPRLPAMLRMTDEARSLYSPASVLLDKSPSPIAVRRYGPIPPCRPNCLSTAAR